MWYRGAFFFLAFGSPWSHSSGVVLTTRKTTQPDFQSLKRTCLFTSLLFICLYAPFINRLRRVVLGIFNIVQTFRFTARAIR